MLNHYCISLPKNGLSVAEVLHYSIYVAVLQGAGELSGTVLRIALWMPNAHSGMAGYPSFSQS